MAKYYILMLIVLVVVLSSCSTAPKYNHPEVVFAGPYKERLMDAASGVKLIYTKLVMTQVACPSHMTSGGITMVCEKDVNHTRLWLQEVLAHEECHHEQLFYGRILVEQMCQDYASKELGINKKMFIGTAIVFGILGILSR